MGRVETSNYSWDSRCGCGHSATEARVCAPPDKEFAELLAGVGVPLVPAGRPVGPMVTWATPRSSCRCGRPARRDLSQPVIDYATQRFGGAKSSRHIGAKSG